MKHIRKHVIHSIRITHNVYVSRGEAFVSLVLTTCTLAFLSVITPVSLTLTGDWLARFMVAVQKPSGCQAPGQKNPL